MHKVIVSLLVAVIFFGWTTAAVGQELRLVNIGLATEQKELLLPLTEGQAVLDCSGSSPRAIGALGDQALLTVCGEMLFLNNIPISPGPLLIIPGLDPLTWNSRNYRGAFIISGKNGKINLINRLGLEDYLMGVVPREVLPEWPMASLKAQAIAARTYTVASLKKHGSANFDLCPTTHCQVYGGILVEHQKTNRAVSETAGQVITYKGKIISAFYHASSGGATEDAVDIWTTSTPYLRPVPDWDFKSPYFQWTKCLEWGDLQGMAARDYPQIGRLNQVFPVSFGKDGQRILKLKLKGDTGEVTISGEQFRYCTGIPSSKMQFGMVYGPEPFINLWWASNSSYPVALIANGEIPGLIAEVLNPPWNLPDPWSWLQDKEPVKVVIRGSGWGHGVGMSQWGSKGMADFGFDERQILGHFYPGTVISNLENIKSIVWR